MVESNEQRNTVKKSKFDLAINALQPYATPHPYHPRRIPDDSVYEQLVQLAETIGLRVGAGGLVSENPQFRTAAIRQTLTEAERQRHLEIIARGGGKRIPDPLAWQRETRQDRPLPGRD